MTEFVRKTSVSRSPLLLLLSALSQRPLPRCNKSSRVERLFLLLADEAEVFRHRWKPHGFSRRWHCAIPRHGFVSAGTRVLAEFQEVGCDPFSNTPSFSASALITLQGSPYSIRARRRRITRTLEFLFSKCSHHPRANLREHSQRPSSAIGAYVVSVQSRALFSSLEGTYASVSYRLLGSPYWSWRRTPCAKHSPRRS
jgi:hypothetical protein